MTVTGDCVCSFPKEMCTPHLRNMQRAARVLLLLLCQNTKWATGHLLQGNTSLSFFPHPTFLASFPLWDNQVLFFLTIAIPVHWASFSQSHPKEKKSGHSYAQSIVHFSQGGHDRPLPSSCSDSSPTPKLMQLLSSLQPPSLASWTQPASSHPVCLSSWFGFQILDCTKDLSG